MQRIIVLVLLAAAIICSVSAGETKWTQKGRAAPTDLVTFRFALVQDNLDTLEKTLLDVADTTSPNYGKWWSREAILDLVAPPKAASQAVIDLLAEQGISSVINHRDSIKVTATVQQVEKLLQTSMYYFQHTTKGKIAIRCDQDFTVPFEIEHHVDFIAGLYELPELRTQARDIIQEGIDGFIIPETLTSLYQIPVPFPTNSNSSLCLAEFLSDQSYLPSDLDLFANGTAIPEIEVKNIHGNFTGTNLESTLDVEFGAAIAQNTTIWFWTEVGWMYELTQDVLNTPNPPLVISMSWGWPEPKNCQKGVANCSRFETAKEYVDRTNVEFQKLGLMGITLLAASGDQGAPGDSNSDCNHIFPFDDVLSSIFPGASPWVLSVGATMLTNSTTNSSSTAPICQQVSCASSTTEEVCTYPEALITTGGGFSNYAAMPSFQENVVNAYLTSGVHLPPDLFYSKTNRAFPDVSALGHNYLIASEGSWEQVDGTSCSTPVWGAIISLLNSHRMNSGKPSLGYVVPLIYQAYASDPSIFTDITSGNNKCTEDCCSKWGFQATKGWDPVTGLGTPIFPKLLNYIESLQ